MADYEEKDGEKMVGRSMRDTGGGSRDIRMCKTRSRSAGRLSSEGNPVYCHGSSRRRNRRHGKGGLYAS